MILVSVALLVLVAAALGFGAYRWAKGSQVLRTQLEGARLPISPVTVDFHEIEELPAVVQGYFRTVLQNGQPMIAAVRVRHEGTFNMGQTADQWRPFRSSQQVITQRPGFDWDGRINLLPGLSVRVHDAYVAGEGILHAALLGLVTVANLRGSRDLAEGELMRFFAEAAWYPTALLPSQGVQWSVVDERTAQAKLTDGDVVVTLLFSFDAEGLIDTVRAEARGRTVGKEVVPTPWQGRFWHYTEREGMRIPLEAEVSWLLPEGTQPYWRGRIMDIGYEFASPKLPSPKPIGD